MNDVIRSEFEIFIDILIRPRYNKNIKNIWKNFFKVLFGVAIDITLFGAVFTRIDANLGLASLGFAVSTEAEFTATLHAKYEYVVASFSETGVIASVTIISLIGAEARIIGGLEYEPILKKSIIFELKIIFFS